MERCPHTMRLNNKDGSVTCGDCGKQLDYAPWEKPPEPDTPKREAYRAATAQASEALRVARETERAARGPIRPLAAGDAPSDDPVPW